MIRRLLRFVKRKIFPVKETASNEAPNFGIRTGTGTTICRPRRPVEGKQYISFGNNSYLGPEAWISAYDAYPYSNQKFDPRIIIGNDVHIGSFAMITAINKIILEDGVETADFIFISDHTHSNVPEEGVSVRKRRLVSRGYVKIGAYTAIGYNAVILPGVTLGKYCLVGAKSVVTHSFPDYSMIFGNPAVLVKTYSVELKKWITPPGRKDHMTEENFDESIGENTVDHR
ncbi:acyltransferase [Flavitalea flava]